MQCLQYGGQQDIDVLIPPEELLYLVKIQGRVGSNRKQDEVKVVII
jgi:hypothetical protein